MPPQTTSDTLNTPPHQNGKQEVTKFETEKSKEDPAEELADTAAIIVPPDGGWGWVVMVASFFCCTILDGIVFSSGLFQPAMAEDFGVSKGYIALVSSLLSGFYLIAGPFASALANRYGFRPVTIVGSIIGGVAFALSYYATSVEFLFITYGLIGGIGFCLVYIPAVITIGYYFEKWRALATGIALSGSGVGTFIFAPLSNYLIEQVGWRYSLVIQGGIVLFCIVCGAAFRPIKPIRVPINEVENESNNALIEKRLPSSQTKPLPEGRFAYSVPNSAHNTYMGAPPNLHYPTAAEVFKGSAANLERRLSAASGGHITPGGKDHHKGQRKSQPTTPSGELAQPTFNLHKELTTVGENEEEAESQNLLEESEVKPVVVTARRHTISGRRPNELRRSSVKTETENPDRPMYRDDIFFTGSLVRIPQYTSQTSLGYHMSVTRLATKQDIKEERDHTCKLCPEAVRRTLSTMLDVSLLKSPSFMLLSTSGFLTMMGFFIPFIFITPRAEAAGMDKGTALFVVSAIGIVNTVARIVCGLLTSFKGINALHLNNVAITAGGIATIFSGYIINSTTQYLYAVVFGICIACFSGLRSIIAVELMGLEKLTNAFGFLMLFQGLAAAIGAPIAGWYCILMLFLTGHDTSPNVTNCNIPIFVVINLCFIFLGVFYDLTGDYDYAFYLAGILITVSAFLCYPLNWVSRWEKERAARKAGSSV